jgi:hypothetical protein
MGSGTRPGRAVSSLLDDISARGTAIRERARVKAEGHVIEPANGMRCAQPRTSAKLRGLAVKLAR